MRRTELLQEVRKMRFEEAYGGWQEGRLTQEEAARMLGVCDRTFRARLIDMKNPDWTDYWTSGYLCRLSAEHLSISNSRRARNSVLELVRHDELS